MSQSSATRLRLSALALGLIVVFVGVELFSNPRQEISRSESAKTGEIEEPVSNLEIPAKSFTSEQRRASTRSLARKQDRELEGSGQFPTKTVTILVYREDQLPIADAKILVRIHSAEFSGRTNEEGESIFELPVANEALTIETTAQGFFHGRFLREQEDVIRTYLYRSAALAGRVLDTVTKEPLRATVKYYHGYCDRLCSFDSTETDRFGRFEFASINVEREPHIGIESAGYARLGIDVSPGKESHFDVYLSRGTVIYAQALDVVSNAPIAGAELSDGFGNTLVSDELGIFEGLIRTSDYRAVPRKVSLSQPSSPGPRMDLENSKKTYELSASADGYLDVQLFIDSNSKSERDMIIVPLVGGASVIGLILNEQGNAVPFTTVQIETSRASGTDQYHRAQDAITAGVSFPVLKALLSSGDRGYAEADASGSFRIDGLRPWAAKFFCTFQLDSRWLKSQSTVRTGEPGSLRSVDLVVSVPERRSATVEGDFRFQGEPYAGTVAWNGALDGGYVRADAEGKFKFSAVPGMVELTPRLNGRSEDAWSSKLGRLDLRGAVTVELEADQSTRVDFDLAVPMTTVHGRLQDEDGIPLPGKVIALHSLTDKYSSRIRTDEDGSFSWEITSWIGEFELVVRHASQLVRFSGFRPDGKFIELVTPREIGVLFHVVDETTGAPIPNYQVHYKEKEVQSGSSGIALKKRTSLGVGWTSSRVLKAQCNLYFSAPGHRARLIEFVALAEGATIDVKLTPELRLRANVPPADLALLMETGVQLLELGYEGQACSSRNEYSGGIAGRSLQHSWVYFDQIGSGSIGGLGPMIYAFRSCPPGLVFDPPTVDLTGGASGEVWLRIRREQ